jgi:hypothetical protein
MTLFHKDIKSSRLRKITDHHADAYLPSDTLGDISNIIETSLKHDIRLFDQTLDQTTRIANMLQLELVIDRVINGNFDTSALQSSPGPSNWGYTMNTEVVSKSAVLWNEDAFNQYFPTSGARLPPEKSSRGRTIHHDTHLPCALPQSFLFLLLAGF